jgi:large subunit ribosomal protein L25
MERIVINASKRDVTGKQVSKLRREGYLPAVLYGAHIQPMPILLNYHETYKILGTTSSSSLVTVNIDGVEHTVLVREKQRDTLKGVYLHVDFLAVSMTESIRTPVSIELVGESPAIEDFNGVLITGISVLDIECLPNDLPEKIVVDISNLKEIGDSITVNQLSISDKVTVHTSGDEVVVNISLGTSEEVETEDEFETEESEPEVIEKGKKEEEDED